jgi:hypothetical protein
LNSTAGLDILEPSFLALREIDNAAPYTDFFYRPTAPIRPGERTGVGRTKD